ncbi:hypothetical protein ACVIYL_009040 [Bradyrhizobium sp. USDA 3315]
MNNLIPTAVNKHFSSSHFEAREVFRHHIGGAAFGEARIYPSPACGEAVRPGCGPTIGFMPSAELRFTPDFGREVRRRVKQHYCPDKPDRK